MREIKVLLILEPTEEIKEAVKNIIMEEGKNWGRRREAEFFYDKEEGIFILIPADYPDYPTLPKPLSTIVINNRNSVKRIDIDIGNIFTQSYV